MTTPTPFDEEDDIVAFARGLGDGFRRMDPRPSRYASAKDNVAYYWPGYILAYVLKIVLVLVALRFGLSVYA